MAIALPGLLLFVICLLVGFGTRLGPVAAAGIALPFEATALMRAAGVGLNVTDAYFMVLMGIALCQAMLSPNGVKLRKKNVVVPLLICMHGIVATLFLPQIFDGVTQVAQVGGGEGTRVGRGFGLTISPLHPTMSNISQLFYLLLQISVFIYLLSQARKHGGKILMQLLLVAIITNFVLVTLQIAGAKAILSWFFTADYRDLTEARIGGFTRLVGAFREAARQGQFSAMGFGMFFIMALQTGKTRHYVLAGGCFLTAMLSMSSTAFVCIGVVMVIASVGTVWRALVEKRGDEMLRLMAMFGATILCFMGLWSAIGTTGRYLVSSLVSTLILNKGDTSSGLERQALLDVGMQVAKATYFMGGGLGSTRANGVMALWLSNLGIIGLGLLLAFLFQIYWPSRLRGVPHDLPLAPSRMAFTVILVACVVSLTMPNLGQLFPITAALALYAAETRPISSRVRLRHVDQRDLRVPPPAAHASA